MGSIQRSILLSLSLPVALTEAKKIKKENGIYIKPSSISIYGGTTELYDIEYIGREKTSIENWIAILCQQIPGYIQKGDEYKEKVVHIYETGKAHTQNSYDYLLEEENIAGRIGFIAAGGLIGILAARRGFFRKLFYCSLGLSGTSSVVYPKEAYAMSGELSTYAKLYGVVGYNFLAGVKPASIKIEKDIIAESVKEISQTEGNESNDNSTEEAVSMYVITKSENKKEVEAEKSEDSPPEGDIGQSNPEDNDMYSTRG